MLESNDETERCEIPHRGRGFEYEIEHAMRCMAAEQLESPEIGSQHTLAVLAIMDEIRDLIGMRYDFE